MEKNQTEFIKAFWFEIHLYLKDTFVSLQCGESVWPSGSQGYDGHLQLSETKLMYHHRVLMTSFLEEDQNDLHQQ